MSAFNAFSNTFSTLFYIFSLKKFDKENNASIIGGNYTQKRNTATRQNCGFFTPNIYHKLQACLIIALRRVGEFLIQYPFRGNQNPSSFVDSSRPATPLCLSCVSGKQLNTKGGCMTNTTQGKSAHAHHIYDAYLEAGIHPEAYANAYVISALTVIAAIALVGYTLGGVL